MIIVGDKTAVPHIITEAELPNSLPIAKLPHCPTHGSSMLSMCCGVLSPHSLIPGPESLETMMKVSGSKYEL